MQPVNHDGTLGEPFEMENNQKKVDKLSKQLEELKIDHIDTFRKEELKERNILWKQKIKVWNKLK